MADAPNPQSPQFPVIAHPAQIYNHDSFALLARIGRYFEEVLHSNSSSVSEVSDADLARLTSYLNALKAFIVYVKAAPQQDLPHTDRMQYTVEELVTFPSIENEDLEYVATLLQTLWGEVVNSESCRMAAGLTAADSKRYNDLIAKIEAYRDNIIAKVSPIDSPATMPLDAVSSGANRSA